MRRKSHLCPRPATTEPLPLFCGRRKQEDKARRWLPSKKMPCVRRQTFYIHISASAQQECAVLQKNWLLETSRPFSISQDKHPDCWTMGGHGRQCSSQLSIPATDWNCNNHDLEVASQPETFRVWQGAFGKRCCVLGLASGGGRAAPSSSPSFGRSQ